LALKLQPSFKKIYPKRVQPEIRGLFTDVLKYLPWITPARTSQHITRHRLSYPLILLHKIPYVTRPFRILSFPLLIVIAPPYAYLITYEHAQHKRHINI
jgi:hypothetical protein